MQTKLSIIGAGSGAFSLSMIRDICLTPNLEGITVSLMDIDPQRLEGAYAVCRRYADELGFRLTLEKTLNREESLEGADFVINTALVAGHHRLREGWEIARRFGYDWGASFHIFYDEPFWVNYYQFRLFESIVEDMLTICPNALLLLVANPVLAAITHLGRCYPEAHIIGLCHGFSGIYGVARTLGLDPDQITFEIPGVNHFVWLTEFYHRGEDAFPILDRWIEEQAESLWAAGKPTPGLGKKQVDLYRRFGAVPIGDTSHWSGASWPLWYHNSAMTEAAWGERPADGWNGYFDHVARNAADFNRVANDPSIRVTELFEPRKTREPMIQIVESVACDIPHVTFGGNIMNRGSLVPGIPEDFEVEVPTLISRRGVQGIQTNGLPPALLAHTLRDRVAPVNLELDAYNLGSRELLTQLIMMDPWSRSWEQARGFVEAVMALDYHDELRRHYR